MNKAIFFDFWGTLWLPSATDEIILKVAQEAAHMGFCENIADAKLRARRFGGVPTPGTFYVLQSLKELAPLVIVTQTPKIALEQILRSWQLESYFTATVSTQQFNESKYQAIERLRQEQQLEPIMYVGDTFADARMAQLLAIDYIHVGVKRDYTDVYGEQENAPCYDSLFAALPLIFQKTRLAVGKPLK